MTDPSPITDEELIPFRNRSNVQMNLHGYLHDHDLFNARAIARIDLERKRADEAERKLATFDTPTTDAARDQGRDLMADAIDGYMRESGEFRSYDLADRLTKKLNLAGWWFVHGGDVERMISQEHPFDVKMKERANAAEAEVARLRGVVEAAKALKDVMSSTDRFDWPMSGNVRAGYDDLRDALDGLASLAPKPKEPSE